MIDLTARHDPLTAERFNATSGQQDALMIVDDTGNDGGFNRLFFEVHKNRNAVRVLRSEKNLSSPRPSFHIPRPLFFRFSLHCCNAQTQGIELDEAFSVGLVVDFIRLEGGEVNIEQAVGL